MIYAFTGVARGLLGSERAYIEAVVMSLENPTGFRTGGAFGVDTAVAELVAKHWPHVTQTIVAPAAPWNHALLAIPGVVRETAPGGRTASDAYMLRNVQLVGRAEVLYAFPDTQHEVQRSGTWATVRRARKAGLTVRIRPLSPIPEDS